MTGVRRDANYHGRRLARRKQNFFAEVGGALLRLSHRVPLISAILAVAAGVGWWYFRTQGETRGAAALSIACAAIGLFFGVLAAIGFLRNLFPEGRSPRSGGR